MDNQNKLMNIKKILETYEENSFKLKSIQSSKKVEFKKYEKPIINSINQMSGGTKAKIVGQMSDIVPVFIKYCLKNEKEISTDLWREWYLDKYPENLEKSLGKIETMSNNFKKIINEINYDSLKKWIENFLFYENIRGLLIQTEIMNLLKEKYPNKSIRPATASEEKKNIDIVIDDINYQIKPLTSKIGTAFNQKWGEEKSIWYKKAIKKGEEIIKYYLPPELED